MYKLDPEVRSQLAQMYDVDALEELLDRTDPESRVAILGAVESSPLRSPENASVPRQPVHRGELPQQKPAGPFFDPRVAEGAMGMSVRLPVYSDDPEEQTLIEKLWRPYLDQQPDEVLKNGQLRLPGVEAAWARRQALRRSDEGGRK